MKNILHLLPVFLIAMALFSPASAQFTEEEWDFDDEEKTEVKKGKISGGILHASYAYSSTDPQFWWGPANGVPASEVDGIPGNWGIDLTVVSRNLVTKFGFYRDFTQEFPFGSGPQKIHNVYREFGLGYNIFSKKGLIVYSTANIGMVRNDATLLFNLTDLTFPDLTGGTAIGTNLSRKSGYFGGEAGFDYMFGFDEASGAGVTLGVRAGYNYQFTDGEWKSFGAVVPNGPNLDMTGAYVRVSVGFAGWHRQ